MRLEWHDDLPQWITSSDVAAYHPASRTIHVRRGLGRRLPGVLLHEMLHWLIDVAGLTEPWHRRLDRGGER